MLAHFGMFVFCSNVEVYTPFAPTELRDDLIDKTYLDTSGRPTISIKKVRCTEKHASDIYVGHTAFSVRRKGTKERIEIK